MGRPQDVLYHAAKRIGYYAPSDPQPGSEAGRYWTARGKGAWLSGPSTSIWWCMLFVSMIFDEAGEIDAIGGFSYNTDVTIGKVRRHPRAGFASVATAQPGDVVIFDWTGDGPTDHVGLVEKNLGAGGLQTIEGNTSPGNAGSQGAGNGVWRRRRHISDGISHVIRPDWSGSGAAESAPVVESEAARTGYGYITVDGVEGRESWNRLRRVMGAWHPAPWSEAVKQMQRFLATQISAAQLRDLIGGPLAIDGDWGVRTTKALQWYLWHHGPNSTSNPASHVWSKWAPGWGLWDFVDGDLGKATWAVLQEALNYSVAESGKLMTWKP